MKDKDDDTAHLSPGLRALADPTRLKILLMLEGKPRTVSEIVDFFDLSQPTISRHLQTLATADLVIRQQRGRDVTYSLNPERISGLFLSLATCFPCCCVTVTTAAGATQAGLCEVKIDTRSGQKETKTRSNTSARTSKRKGEPR